MLIATDVDGTLLPNNATEVGDYTAEVLRRADQAGVYVVFVTARPLRWMVPLWQHVGKHGLAVVSNGAVIDDVPSASPVTVHGIEPSAGLELAEAITATAPGTSYAVECLDGKRYDSGWEPWEEWPLEEGAPRGPLQEVWDVPAVKLLVRNTAYDDVGFRQLVLDCVGEKAVASWSGPGLVEISAAGVTKASALTQLCHKLDVEPADVVAFGDMPNDLPMLAFAGTSYAVQNADPAVLQAVDHVAPAVTEEGVAQVIDLLLAS
ncbi:HAD hydrolase family protein [Nesterenkonia alkaliphila]|uniref:HAD hydrolase family protein n=1 Tax=Nesterenkonia alkaliphila TaxID=1463631 RepID=UPI0016649102|nr:HAD hydrolase family protein [Nesterenkonia alkaliphila]GFZ96193.1 haloacid dehalogenase [Nesterenkonia alkaliphila]